ncbi:MAG: glycosyltransferase family 4 protein [Planctomycetota bacterium]
MSAARIAVQCWLLGTAPSGARRRLLDLIEGLAELPESRELELFFLSSAFLAPDRELETRVSRLPGAVVDPIPIRPAPTWRRVLAERRVLAPWLAARGISLLDLASLPVARLDVPTVLTVHDTRDLGPYARPFRSLTARAVLRTALRRAARVLVPSPPVAEEIRRQFPRVEAKLELVPAGLADRFFDDVEPDPDLPSPCFLHLGRPERRKALDFLLEAFSMGARRNPSLPPLVLAGPGREAEWSELRGLAGRLGIGNRVEWPGLIAEERLPALLRSALALVCPSRLEGFGLPVLEAMAAGRPALVARGGACAWVAGSGALALPAEDPAAWADAMLRLFCDAKLAKELGRAARRRAEDFRIPSASRAWVRAWRRVLATRAIPGSARREEERHGQCVE